MLKKINDIAKQLNLQKDEFETYGNYKAKIFSDKIKSNADGKLILVTAITPTKAGEGKTTCSIALADGLKLLGKKVCLALREPSLGPVFGIKGGATGGGKVTVEPSEDINLHFNGDMHALTSSNNLISAIIDNHIFQGNELNIDPQRIVFPRAMDMNDRALRHITVAEGKNNGIPHEDSFVITVASELMAIMCLSENEDDFVQRLKRIIVAFSYENKPITVGDLKISNAVLKLMKNALYPNLVQTSFNTPAIIHGGPFANIAHGCNSIIGTKTALKLADYVVTEAGFGSDLGAEKFLDIKCRVANLNPSVIVLVATLRALKCHGGATDLEEKNIEALTLGFENLEAHIQNLSKFNKPVVIAINHFASDTKEEIELLEKWCKDHNYSYAFTDGFINGAKGAKDLANLVLQIIEKNELNPINYTYSLTDSIEEKIDKIAKNIYYAKNVEYSELAKKQLEEYKKLNIDDYFVCIAKTPASFSDNPKLLNVPKDHTLHIRQINIAAGSKFIIPISGTILTMPGLPKIPAAVKMEEENGN